MNFIGFVTFNGSNAQSRETLPATFDVISDWYQSVVEYYKQEVITGNYDGYHVTVSVTTTDAELVIDTTIENPWAV